MKASQLSLRAEQPLQSALAVRGACHAGTARIRSGLTHGKVDPETRSRSRLLWPVYSTEIIHSDCRAVATAFPREPLRFAIKFRSLKEFIGCYG